MSIEKALELIKESEAKFIDLRFTDTKGKEQHVSIPTHQIDDDFFEEGKMFDGSSIAGWKGINESDMVLMPDPTTVVIDPFAEETQINIRCDIVEPLTMEGYERDPRSVAKRAEEYLKFIGLRSGTAQALGLQYLLLAGTVAAFIGGVSILGGKGGVVGAAIGSQHGSRCRCTLR